ncbi:hypothetical protein Ocin01_03458 [Orchesella cincta]|uniref:Uncharacterized protein n=1 Tax=Orchesella cincta TaxID=48709 RepID=A0A1D2NDA6_ORCCI|nr:hypothetical protein Ocin01_03458 [Orchesella cincta]
MHPHPLQEITVPLVITLHRCDILYFCNMGSCVGLITEKCTRRRITLSYIKLSKSAELNQLDCWTPILRDESQEILNIAALKTKPEPNQNPSLELPFCSSLLNNNCSFLKTTEYVANDCEYPSLSLKVDEDVPVSNSVELFEKENVSMAIEEHVGEQSNSKAAPKEIENPLFRSHWKLDYK